MNTHARDVTGGYNIRVEDLAGPATARIGTVVVARSDRARVMYETRLPPMVYFPEQDVTVPLSEPTALQTFCPFKGTATYRDIVLPDRTLPNATWTYANGISSYGL